MSFNHVKASEGRLMSRGYVVSNFGQDGFAMLKAEAIGRKKRTRRDRQGGDTETETINNDPDEIEPAPE